VIVARQHDVGGLKVAMDEPQGVSLVEGEADLAGDVDDRRDGSGPSALTTRWSVRPSTCSVAIYGRSSAVVP
jgi:hypothetical protein